MVWERIVKKDEKEWEDLGDVLTGEYDYEKWKDKPIPNDLKELQALYNTSPPTAKKDIKILFESAKGQSNNNKQQVFDLIKIILQAVNGK
tara:strand:+ start:2023 stop:2292 length:270 start_codon:yes stop_codon:yes gene_type:complete